MVKLFCIPKCNDAYRKLHIGFNSQVYIVKKNKIQNYSTLDYYLKIVWEK